MKSFLLSLLGLLMVTAGNACDGYRCGGHDQVIHHRIVVGHGQKLVTYPIYADKPEHMFVLNPCNTCGRPPAPVVPLVANAVIDRPCLNGGWYLKTPIYGVSVVNADGCGGPLYPGRRIHVNRRGDWNSVEGGGHC